MRARPERIPGESLRRDRPAPSGATDGPLIGVLALQGDVLEHVRMFAELGARAVPVKRADELDRLDGIVLPGGESTTIGKLAVMYDLLEPLRKHLEAGLPALGTCAGAILLARRVLTHDGSESSQPVLGVLDATVRRNAFGRQVDSFEADLDVAGIDGGPMRAVFIRAPWVENAGPEVEVLATVGTPQGPRPVVVRQGALLAAAFHPELTGDPRLHARFLETVEQRTRPTRG